MNWISKLLGQMTEPANSRGVACAGDAWATGGSTTNLVLQTPDGENRVYEAYITPQKTYIKLANQKKFRSAQAISKLYGQFLHNISHTPDIMEAMQPEKTLEDCIIVSVDSSKLISSLGLTQQLTQQAANG